MHVASSLGRALLVSSLSLLGTACGGSGPPVLPETDAGPRRDAGRDAGRETLDAEIERDAEVESDGGEGVDGSIPIVGCVATDLELAVVTSGSVGRVELAAGADRFAVAWADRFDGFPEIAWAVVDADGDRLGGSTTSLHAPSGDPTVVATSTGFLVGYRAAVGGDADVYAQPIGPSGLAIGSHGRVSSDVGRDDRPVLASSGSSFLAVWGHSDASSARSMVARRVDAATGAGTGTVQTVIAAPTAPPPGSAGVAVSGSLVGAVRSGVDMADVVVQQVGTDGAAIGEPHVASTQRNGSGAVDLATTEDGGAVVFGALAGGVTEQVHARSISGTGATTSTEALISPIEDTATEPSIAMYAGGYVVAYRRHHRGEEAGLAHDLVLAFLSPSLAVLSESNLGPVSELGSVRIRVSTDGRLAMARAEVGASTRVVFSRITCGEL